MRKGALPLVLCMLVGWPGAAAVGAAPAKQAVSSQRVAEKERLGVGAPNYPAAVKRSLRYLPSDGFVVHWSRPNRRVIHIKMVEDATPENDWFGIFDDVPPGAVWITVYTIRYEQHHVLVCVGGLGVIRRYSTPAPG